MLAYNVRCICTAAFATHQVSGQALCLMATGQGGGGVHKVYNAFIKTSTESTVFSRNRPKPTAYKILRTIKTLIIGIRYHHNVLIVVQ